MKNDPKHFYTDSNAEEMEEPSGEDVSVRIYRNMSTRHGQSNVTRFKRMCYYSQTCRQQISVCVTVFEGGFRWV